MKTEILLHIPHSSYFIPDEYKSLFVLSPLQLEKEQILMTDSYTDELFDLPFSKLVFPISRLVCDVERFREEGDEEMTKLGMWVCYTKTHNLKQLKFIDEAHKQEILARYYDVHHKKFENEVDKILNLNKKCLIIDCHSFPSKALPYELYQEDLRPDICIGTDDFHTSKKLTLNFANLFEQIGYRVVVNEPFKGSIVPLKFYRKDKCVQSIMIEINRSLYMEEITGQKLEKFQVLKNNIYSIFSKFYNL